MTHDTGDTDPTGSGSSESDGSKLNRRTYLGALGGAALLGGLSVRARGEPGDPGDPGDPGESGKSGESGESDPGERVIKLDPVRGVTADGTPLAVGDTAVDSEADAADDTGVVETARFGLGETATGRLADGSDVYAFESPAAEAVTLVVEGGVHVGTFDSEGGLLDATAARGGDGRLSVPAGNDGPVFVHVAGAENAEYVLSSAVATESRPTGEIEREYWLDIGGASVSSIPTDTAPDATETVTSLLEGPQDWDDSYGQRFEGYLTAPESGEYTFWIAGDDHVELQLSADDTKANASVLAHHEGWTYHREWTKYESQSGTVTLSEGEDYYLQVRHKEGGGGDHVSVGWRTPTDGDGDGAAEVVPASRLSPYDGGDDDGGADTTAPTAPTNLAATGTDETTVDLSWDGSTDEGGSGLDHYDVFVDGTRDHRVPANTTSASVSGLDSDTAYDVHVTAVDGAGNESDPSNTLTVRTDPDLDETPPSAPTGLRSPANDVTSVDLAWDASTDEGGSGLDHYVVSVDGTSDHTVPAGTTTATVTGLSDDTAYDFSVAAVDGRGNESAPSKAIRVRTDSSDTPAGEIEREYWLDIGGATVSSIPTDTAPDGTETVTSLLEGPQDWDDSYGQRFEGYLTAPESGEYTFWIAGDDHVELQLSADDTKANASVLAHHEGWTYHREWTKYESQSGTVTLSAGQRYYLQVRHKEGGGGDHVSVGWRTPDDGDGTGPAEVVPASELSPWDGDDDGADTTAPTQPTTLTVTGTDETTVDLSWDESTDEGGSGLDHYLVFVDGTSDHTVPAGTTTTMVTGLSDDTTYDFSVTAVDGRGNQSPSSNAVTATTDASDDDGRPVGEIEREYWLDVSGTNVTDVPVATEPDGSETVTSLLESPQDWDDYYAQRFEGYLTAPESGEYTFWIAGDNQVELQLSTDDTKVNASPIADHEGWTPYRDWDKYESQSGTVTLSEGEEYYLQVLHKEAGGADHVSVGWRTPTDGDGDEPAEVVPVSQLSPYDGDGNYDTSPPTRPTNLTSPGHGDTSVDLSWDPSTDPGVSWLDHYGIFIDGSLAMAVAADTTTATVTDLEGDTTYEITVAAFDGRGNQSPSSNKITVTTDIEQLPYGGSPHDATDSVQAEDFDTGGEGLATHDTTSANDGDAGYRPDSAVDISSRSGDGYTISHTAAGEWLEYTVDVPNGVYDIQFRVAASEPGGELSVSLDGETLGTVTVPDTGGRDDWSTVAIEDIALDSETLGTATDAGTGGQDDWSTVAIEDVSLDGGTGVLRLDIVTGGFELDWVSFSSATEYARQNTTMDQLIGANSFHDDPLDRQQAVGHIREYHDWYWDEGDFGDYDGYPNNEIKFAPSYAGGGTWNFDQFYREATNADIDVQPCLKQAPLWLGSHMRDKYTIPTDGPDASTTDAHSYHAKAHYMYQFVARYGDTSVDPADLTLADDQPVESGMGIVDYVEDWNEQDLFWEGPDAEFSPEEYAAMSSASYDGHAGTMSGGTGTFGVKNADPNVNFVMGGLYDTNLQYIKDMAAWYEANRPDGAFVPDVINVHHYSHEGGQGLSPEEDDVRGIMEEFTDWRDANHPEVEVWISEFGWGTNPGTNINARPVGPYDSQEVQGQWLVRAYLEFAAAGVDRAQMFMLRDTNSYSGARFATHGMIKQKGDWAKKTSWYYVKTTKETLAGTRFDTEVESGHDDVRVYRFAELGGDRVVYALWCPTTSATTVSEYQLDLPEAPASATLVELVEGRDGGRSTELSVSGGSVTVSVSERPVFVAVDPDE